jgi:phage host-nuclease inhibitor protein Gam
MDMLNRAAENLQNEGWDEEAAAVREAADKIERLRKELADLLADVKACFCKQRENEINQLFEELNK